MSKFTSVSPNSSMQSFFLDVTKSFAKHSGPNEIITYHAPETHGHEPLHSQFNLINRENGNCFKVKLNE